MSSPVTPFTPYDISALPPPRTVHYPTSGSNLLLLQGAGLIIAVVMANVSPTTPAVFFLQDGTDTSGFILMPLACPVSNTISPNIAPPGILFRNGLFLQANTGAANVSVHYVPLLSQP